VAETATLNILNKEVRVLRSNRTSLFENSLLVSLSGIQPFIKPEHTKPTSEALAKGELVEKRTFRIPLYRLTEHSNSIIQTEMLWVFLL
jgi:hypothetical protein